MNSGQLSFIGTPFSIALSLMVVVATAALGYYAWRRSGYSRSLGMLELLRFAIVALVALLLNQPEWIQEYRPDVKPTIAVLWDDSQSMQTQDVLLDSSTKSAAISRAKPSHR